MTSDRATDQTPTEPVATPGEHDMRAVGKMGVGDLFATHDATYAIESVRPGAVERTVFLGLRDAETAKRSTMHVAKDTRFRPLGRRAA